CRRLRGPLLLLGHAAAGHRDHRNQHGTDREDRGECPAPDDATVAVLMVRTGSKLSRPPCVQPTPCAGDLAGSVLPRDVGTVLMIRSARLAHPSLTAASSPSRTSRPASRTATVSASRWVGSATLSPASAPSMIRIPPGRSRRSASVTYCGY